MALTSDMRQAPTSIERKHVVADDGMTFYYHEIAGAPKSPTLITHGFGANGGAAAAMTFSALARDAGLRVIGISFRSMGENAAGNAVPMSIERAARDLHAVISMVHVDSQDSRVAVFGNSIGANVLWRYADLFGEEYVDRYIFVDQPVCVQKSFEGRQPIPGLVDRLRSSDSSEDHQFANLIEDSESTDNTERIPRCIHRPCLVYGGEASFVPHSIENARWIASHVNGPARILIYPKPYGTHSPQKEEAQLRFCGDVAVFLATPEDDLRGEEKPIEQYSIDP